MIVVDCWTCFGIFYILGGLHAKSTQVLCSSIAWYSKQDRAAQKVVK
jgi:hypothetical protein